MFSYNSQRDNYTFAGKFKAFWQCFSTSAWMFLSWYIPGIDGTDDEGLAKYLDDVEDSVGKPGMGEKIKNKFNWIKGKTSYWWLVQRAGIEVWMWKNGIHGTCKFSDYAIDFDKLNKLLESGPVIFGTNKIGRLPGGHIILVMSYVGGSYICNDPFGNATSHYQDTDGEKVVYPDWYLKKYCGNKKGLVRCLWWEYEEKKA